MTDEIAKKDEGWDLHGQLQSLGIRHFCHYGNPWSITDLGMATIMCTECRIWNGEFTVEDLVTGKIDPLDVKYALDRVARLQNEARQKRIDGKEPWHRLHWPTIKSEGHPKDGQIYERVDCFSERGSASVPEDRVCPFCKQSVDS